MPAPFFGLTWCPPLPTLRTAGAPDDYPTGKSASGLCLPPTPPNATPCTPYPLGRPPKASEPRKEARRVAAPPPPAARAPGTRAPPARAPAGVAPPAPGPPPTSPVPAARPPLPCFRLPHRCGTVLAHQSARALHR